MVFNLLKYYYNLNIRRGSCVPNWLVHNKWTDKAGIDRHIANYVDRNIDYGTQWVEESHNTSYNLHNNNERIVIKQLRYFYKKDRKLKRTEENLHVKAFYIHHLLDYFRETRYDILNLDLVFKKFLQEKVIDEIYLDNGNLINFQLEIQSIFKLFRNHKDQLFADLEGDYISPTPKKNTT